MLQGGLAAFGNEQVNGLCAYEFHVGARSVKMRVVGYDVAFFAGHAEQNALGGTTLVRGDHVLVAANVLD